MDLTARQQALQQRLRDLTAQVQQLNADALKVVGALELLQQLIQERDGQAAPVVAHTTGDRSAAAQNLGDALLP